MTELVPISYGLLVGLCLSLLAPRQRVPTSVAYLAARRLRARPVHGRE